MRVRDGEERERERRIQLRVYIQKKSNETHKRQKRLKSMGGDTREDHIQHTLYTPRDSRALSPRAPRKRGAQAADLSGSLGTVEGTRPEHAHTHLGRPVALTWPVHTFQVRAGDSQCARRPSSLLPSHDPHLLLCVDCPPVGGAGNVSCDYTPWLRTVCQVCVVIVCELAFGLTN